MHIIIRITDNITYFLKGQKITLINRYLYILIILIYI